MAGWRGLLFPNVQHNYHSPGVILQGEPTNIFEVYDGMLFNRMHAGEITATERNELRKEFANRIQQQHRLLSEYRGMGFTEKTGDGVRAFEYRGMSVIERPLNKWLMLAGTLLTFGGVFGFIVEQRLRRIRSC